MYATPTCIIFRFRMRPRPRVAPGDDHRHLDLLNRPGCDQLEGIAPHRSDDLGPGGVCRERGHAPSPVGLRQRRAIAGGSGGLPAGVGTRAHARLWLLADHERAHRSTHRQEALRPGCRRGHARRPDRRPCGHRHCLDRRLRGDAALPRRIEPPVGLADSAARAIVRRRAERPQRAQAPSAEPARSGLRVLAEAPYLRSLAALVLLGTMGAVVVDFLFKVQVKETFNGGPSMLRSSMAILAGGIGRLLLPGLPSVVAVRGGRGRAPGPAVA